MKSASSKLGKDIVLTVSAFILLTCTVVAAISIGLFSSLNERSLEDTTRVGVSVLKDDMEYEYDRICSMLDMLNCGGKAAQAVADGSTDVLSDCFDEV